RVGAGDQRASPAPVEARAAVAIVTRGLRRAFHARAAPGPRGRALPAAVGSAGARAALVVGHARLARAALRAFARVAVPRRTCAVIGADAAPVRRKVAHRAVRAATRVTNPATALALAFRAAVVADPHLSRLARAADLRTS